MKYVLIFITFIIFLLLMTFIIKPQSTTVIRYDKYFTISNINNYYILYNPITHKNQFYLGVDTITPKDSSTPFKVWNKETITRLRDFGFDGGGAWCDPRLKIPHGIVLNILKTFPDIDDPLWEQKVENLIESKVTPKDEYLIGYWLDNEPSLIKTPKKYYITANKLIRKYDKVHLILGCRWNRPPFEEEIVESKGLVDCHSFNIYSDNPILWDVEFNRVYTLSGVPSFISEFSFYSDENSSGCKNTHGYGGRSSSQEDRVNKFINIIKHWRENPLIVGASWFQWRDEPREGRYDGEDCNYGILDINDVPYPIALISKTP